MRSLLLIATALPAVLCFNYTIAVGKDEVTGLPGVGFAPSRTVTQGTDDLLVFSFLQGEHQVVESAFERPCSPAGEFDTGLRNVTNGTIAGGPEFIYPIANSSVVAFFYDAAGNNCLQGSVFCVNTDAETCQAHRRAALALGAAAGVPTSIRSNSAFVAPSTTASSTTRASATTTRSAAASAVVMSGAGMERGVRMGLGLGLGLAGVVGMMV